jgi:CPA2 family monovalent cation:H+ antiporter-2
MPHTPLIATIVAALVLAFLLGALANRLRISPLVGYLIAGIIIGPYTPGFVADQSLAAELAEIGVILLMFGVGLHFSIKDLLAVAKIAVPGAAAQIACATLLGALLGWAMGWSLPAGIMFGLALSVASTVVLLRAMQQRHLIETERGQIAVGWLIVEDIAMVLALVLIPAIAGAGAESGTAHRIGLTGAPAIAFSLALTVGKLGAFTAIMLVAGRRVIPWVLHRIAHTGSRELFRLAVLAISLGVAYGCAYAFEVSFALGAFFAGMILAESELSQQAAEETLPLRDAFAVLFFVSVGMLFDPQILWREPWPLLATLGIILLGKSIAALLIVRAFGYRLLTAATISVSLAQIGEFSFILAGLGVALGLLPESGRDLILAGAILSIIANPALFSGLDRLAASLLRGQAAEAAVELPRVDVHPSILSGHTVVIGYGRVGAIIGEGLRAAGEPFVAVETNETIVQGLQHVGVAAYAGNAADPAVLAATNIGQARTLFVAIPDAFEAGQIVEQARAANAGIEIIARAHSDAGVDHLNECGADMIVMGEREIAQSMLSLARRARTRGSPAGAPAV